MPVLAKVSTCAVSTCLAGATKLPFKHFTLGWAINSIPYAASAAYAGSLSSFTEPKPAILSAIGLTAALWLAWYVFTKRVKCRAS